MVTDKCRLRLLLPRKEKIDDYEAVRVLVISTRGLTEKINWHRLSFFSLSLSLCYLNREISIGSSFLLFKTFSTLYL